MIGIQLVGVVVGLAAIHLSHLYYKRMHFSKRELWFWAVLWGAFIFIAIFPLSVAPVVGYLGLTRSMDLIMIVAFVILFSLAFHNYILGRKQERQLERLVRELALRDIDADKK
jgi:hypothetical protein